LGLGSLDSQKKIHYSRVYVSIRGPDLLWLYFPLLANLLRAIAMTSSAIVSIATFVGVIIVIMSEKIHLTVAALFLLFLF
jgi:hypothetical protein